MQASISETNIPRLVERMPLVMHTKMTIFGGTYKAKNSQLCLQHTNRFQSIFFPLFD